MAIRYGRSHRRNQREGREVTRREHLLTLLAEECAEVAQRASKALRFGVDEIQPGQGDSNAIRIMDELEDIRVIVELLREEGVLPVGAIDYERFERKRAKVEKYIAYAKEKCGTIQ
jgi:hypothetical protein